MSADFCVLVVLLWCRGCLDTPGFAQMLAAAVLLVLVLPVTFCRGCMPAVGGPKVLAGVLLACAAVTLVAHAVPDDPHRCAAVWKPGFWAV